MLGTYRRQTWMLRFLPLSEHNHRHPQLNEQRHNEKIYIIKQKTDNLPMLYRIVYICPFSDIFWFCIPFVSIPTALGCDVSRQKRGVQGIARAGYRNYALASLLPCDVHSIGSSGGGGSSDFFPTEVKEPQQSHNQQSAQSYTYIAFTFNTP